ncbi:hypothetical protein M426DRAFT_267084 [Hypoxylon sp. CI-4A]|nr:hypothetical protein M426DRAFT_267084 [Hypoxylon sp. CI-4A]
MIPLASNVALATIICTYVFTFLAIMAIIVHIYTFMTSARKVSLEDFSTLVAFVITLGLVGQITWAVVDEGQANGSWKKALWALVNTLIRLSALISLHRICGMMKTVRFLSVILMSISIAHGIAALLTALLICRPVHAAWDTRVQDTCGNQTAAYESLEFCGLVIDMAILALPVWPVSKLHIPMRRRLGVLLILSAGAVCTSWYHCLLFKFFPLVISPPRAGIERSTRIPSSFVAYLSDCPWNRFSAGEPAPEAFPEPHVLACSATGFMESMAFAGFAGFTKLASPGRNYESPLFDYDYALSPSNS